MQKKTYFYLKNNISYLSKLEKKVKNFCKKNSLQSNVSYKINLICEEIFVNLVMYDKHPIDSITVKITLEKTYNAISITIKDNGYPFNPLEKELLTFNRNADTNEIGGFGIYLVQQWASTIQYNYENLHNVLIVKKKTR